MTKLEPGRPVVRESSAFDRTDPLIVELHPTHVVIRLKGHPDERVQVSLLQLFRYGGRLPR